MSPRVIGPGWSDDPEERARQIADQERVVSALAVIEEKVSIFDLEDYAREHPGGR